MNEIKISQIFTIVSATYNVEKYLDYFFTTIVTQSLIFEKYINIIMVDDGSTDNSKKIIEKWIKKYPLNIQYVQKINEGQSSARNLGLQYVKTKWVTFIDPDDFISRQYFNTINSFLKRNKKYDISMISCKIVYYFEKQHLTIDYHPLRYVFREKETILKASNLKKNIQLSASSTFFKTAYLKNNKIEFLNTIKPNFEDGYFIGEYLLKNLNSSIAFLKDAKYCYRKRKNATSSIDNSWTNSMKYNELLRFGYLDLLQKYKQEIGSIPKHIQRTILYDLMWHYKIIVNNEQLISFLSYNQKETYKYLLQKIFTYIDNDTILDFELFGEESYYKIAFIYLYKNTQLPYQIIHIDTLFKNKTKLRFHYFSLHKENCIISSDNNKVMPTLQYVEKYYFIDIIFIYKYNVELDIDKNSTKLNIHIDGLPTYLGNKKFPIKIKDLKVDKLIAIKKIAKNIGRKVLL